MAFFADEPTATDEERAFREAWVYISAKPDAAIYFVQPATIWPTRDHSIKTLATFLGFKWRDTNPSGAASIEWYARWSETCDPAVKQQILEYNEDDCRATRVLLDGIRQLTA